MICAMPTLRANVEVLRSNGNDLGMQGFTGR
jgi:hypothetical protein